MAVAPDVAGFRHPLAQGWAWCVERGATKRSGVA